jgi:hypothetical protein
MQMVRRIASLWNEIVKFSTVGRHADSDERSNVFGIHDQSRVHHRTLAAANPYTKDLRIF